MAHDVEALPGNGASGRLSVDLDDRSPEKALASLLTRPVNTSTFLSSHVEGMNRRMGKDSDDVGSLRARKMVAALSDSAFLPEIYHRSPLAAGSKSETFGGKTGRPGNVLALLKDSRQHPAESHAHADESPVDASTRSRSMLLHMRDVGPTGMDPIARLPGRRKKSQPDLALSLGKSSEGGADNEAEGAAAEKEEGAETEIGLDMDAEATREEEEQALVDHRFDAVSMHEIASSTVVLYELPAFKAFRKAPAHRSPAERLLLRPFLECCPPIKGLSAASLDSLCASVEVKEFRNGDLVFEEGDDPDGFYIVLIGLAHVLSDSGGLGLQPVNNLSPGQGFGELALLHKSHRSATVQVANNNGLMVAYWDAGHYAEHLDALHRTDNRYYSSYVF